MFDHLVITYDDKTTQSIECDERSTIAVRGVARGPEAGKTGGEGRLDASFGARGEPRRIMTVAYGPPT